MPASPRTPGGPRAVSLARACLAGRFWHLLLGGLGLKIQADLTPERNDVTIALDNPALAGLRIAVLVASAFRRIRKPARMAQPRR